MADEDLTAPPTPSQDPEEGEAPGLEARLRRLEEIVTSLEASDLDLDRALSLFQEGVEHIRASEALLAKAELQVEELLAGKSGGPDDRLRPFPGEGDQEDA